MKVVVKDNWFRARTETLAASNLTPQEARDKARELNAACSITGPDYYEVENDDYELIIASKSLGNTKNKVKEYRAAEVESDEDDENRDDVKVSSGSVATNSAATNFSSNVVTNKSGTFVSKFLKTSLMTVKK